MKILLDTEHHSIKTLLARGLPRQLLAFKAFEVDDVATSFISEVDGLKPKRIEKKKQLIRFKEIVANPLSKPYLYCISSAPNDNQARLLAAFIMQAAVKNLGKGGMNKSPPLWHNITGGFSNPMLDKFRDLEPSMLILSNVPENSTPVKLEKLRDILEVYSNIPRIVVTTPVDPLTFFNTKIFSSLNGCIHLTSRMVKKATDI